MSQTFEGLDVKVTRKDGSTVTGMVQSINPETRTLTLNDTTLLFRNQSHYHAVYHVNGQDVNDIQIVGEDETFSTESSLIDEVHVASSSLDEEVELEDPGFLDPAIITAGPTVSQNRVPAPPVNAYPPMFDRSSPLEVASSEVDIGSAGAVHFSAEDDESEGELLPLVDDIQATPTVRVLDFEQLMTNGNVTGATNFQKTSRRSQGRQGNFPSTSPYNGKRSDRPRNAFQYYNRAVETDDTQPDGSSAASELDDSEAGQDMSTMRHKNKDYGKYGSPSPRYQPRYSRQQSGSSHHSFTPNRRTPRKTFRKPFQETWADGDVKEYKEEFDFQRNLDLFDKAKIFEEIRSNDPVDPDTLLVNINVRSDSQRNAGRSQYGGPSSSMARNLAPTENVLDPAPMSSMARMNGINGSDEDEGESGVGFSNYHPLVDEGMVSSPEGSDEDDIVNRLDHQMRAVLGDIGVASNVEGDDVDSGAVKSTNPSRGNSNTAKPNGRTRHTSDRTGLRQPHRLAAPEPVVSSGHNLRELAHTRSHNAPDDKLSRSTQSVPHAPVDAPANHQRLLKKHQFRTAAGIPVPGVTYNQYRKLERITTTEVGPSDEQIIENAGRSCAIMCIKILGGSRRIKPNNHNAPPVVLFMCGNNRLGAMGLCAARHLVNHGCEVLATVAGKNRDFVKHVYNQLPLAGKSGVRLLTGNSELPDHSVAPVDVIVDGLLGAYQTFKGLTTESERVLVSKLVGWANANKAPVLSLEMPSGHANLTPAELELAPSDQAIVPRWTLCFGAPSAALTSRDMTGELTLADVGIPHVMWARAGVKTWSNPWGADFLVPLEYA